jgi:hypothetical protein
MVLDNSFLNSSKVIYGLTAFTVILFLAGHTLLRLGSPTWYNLWSHLGSGTMQIGEALIPFGDLIHITAAAVCVTGAEIGQNSCDPWGRAFNQNPDVPRFLDVIGLTNVHVLGVGSYLLISLLLFLIIQKWKLYNISFVIFILSPPFVLAIDRSNEIITMFLILLGFLFLESNKNYLRYLSCILFICAAIFKLWPILLIGLLSLFMRETKRRYLLIALIFSAGYWLFKAGKILKMLDVTQNGSPYGVAFGVKLFFSNQLNLINLGYLVMIAITITALWIRSFGQNLTRNFKSSVENHRLTSLIPFLLTYVGIWIFSDSFIYRMLILLPALLILISSEMYSHLWAKGAITLILVTVLTSRLSITTSVSSSLALVFVYISFKYILIWFQDREAQR